jgi:hypothetical protein
MHVQKEYQGVHVRGKGAENACPRGIFRERDYQRVPVQEVFKNACPGDFLKKSPFHRFPIGTNSEAVGGWMKKPVIRGIF